MENDEVLIDNDWAIEKSRFQISHLVHSGFSYVSEHICLSNLQEIVPEHKLVPLKKTEALSAALNTFLGSCMYYTCSRNKWFNKQEQSSVKLTKGTFHLSELAGQDHCRTSQLTNEIGYFQRVFTENHILPLYIIFRIWLSWLDSFDKSRNRIIKGMVWPVSSDKWKAP